MARAIWSGALGFGLVSVPVKLYGAVTPKAVRFHQLNSETGARISQKRVDASTGNEVPFEQIIKGYELVPDRYITVDPEELENLAPKQTKAIALEIFTDEAQVSPMLYGSSYYLAPDAGATKAYTLLADALAASGKAGIGRLVLRTKEYLVIVRAQENVVGQHILMASTAVWPDEVNPSPDLDAVEYRPQELDMARRLIDSLTETFDHDQYEDTYREKVLALIESKAAGETFEMPEQEQQPEPQADLLAALEASLDNVADVKPKIKSRSTRSKAKASK